MSNFLILEPARRQVAIAGTVTDGQTSKPIGGALVKITSGPETFNKIIEMKAIQYGATWDTLKERPDLFYTRPDGHYHFVNLPDGSYTLDVSLPGSGTRYGSIEGLTAVVERDGEGSISWSMADAVDVTLQPTTVMGKVIGKQNDPVFMAGVVMMGSGEQTYTDEQGEFSLVGVETGQRKIKVSAQGYQSAEVLVESTQGDSLTQPGEVMTLADIKLSV